MSAFVQDAVQGAKHSPRWWDESVTEPHHAVMGAARKFLEGPRRAKLRALERLYDDAIASADVAKILGFSNEVIQRIPIARSALDTVHNRIAKDRPRPQFVTENGNWLAEQKAELQTTWCDGQFEQLEIYQKGSEVLKDAGMYGTGALKTTHVEGELVSEIVWIGDLHVPAREERCRAVRTLYQTIPMDVEQACRMYPDCEAAIRGCAKHKDDESDDESDELEVPDLVLIVEAWHLPEGCAYDDEGKEYIVGGRHVVCCEGATLSDESWERKRFPFDFVHWRSRPRRFFGLGVIESVAPAHIDANELADSIGASYELMTPGIMAMKGSINPKRQTNEIGRVIEYTGTPPMPWVPPPVDPLVLQREQMLESRGFEGEGISRMAAKSETPSGMKSGAALMTHADIETERFALLSRAYEDFYVGVAKTLIATAEDICNDEELSKTKKLRVLGGRKMVEAIEYQEARLDEGEFVIRVWPVSQLAQTPQGRLEQVDLLRQIGVLTDPDDIRGLLDMPDLDRANSLALSGRDLCNKMISNALRGKEFDAHPYMPLDYMMQRATQEHALAMIKGAPDEALQDLRSLIGLTQTLIERKKREDAAAVAANAPPPGMPPGVPPMVPPMGPPPPPPGMPPDIGIAA